MCGICSSTGVNVFPTPAPIGPGGSTGLALSVADVNPLSGLPLLPSQKIVTSNCGYINPPRKTVVDPSKPSTWPRWIVAVDGQPVDNCAPGGTYLGPQMLPELSVSGFPWGLLLLVVVLILLAGRRR